MSKKATAVNKCVDVLMNRSEVADAIRQYYEDGDRHKLADTVYKAAHKQWKFLMSTRISVSRCDFYETVIRECLAQIRFRTWASKRNMNQNNK